MPAGNSPVGVVMEYFKQAFDLILHNDPELRQIILTTLEMSFFSTVISSFIGIILGVILGRAEFRGKGIIIRILNTLMSLPPVVAGLVVFMLFRSVGPFGSLHLMFSVTVMVIAQVLLITPVVCGLSASAAEEKSVQLTETALGIGVSRLKQTGLLIRECSGQFVSIVLLAFGRSIAEVGAVSMVGGNIQFKTRVMTTAIMLESNKGDFEKALALGIILLFISFAVNIIAYTLKEKIK